MNTISQKIRSAIAAVAKAISLAPRKPKTIPDTPITALLMHLCNQDEKLALFVAKWIAFPLRYPRFRNDTALLISGQQGTGASLFFERIVAPLHRVGQYGAISRETLFDKYNDWAINQSLVIVHDCNIATEFKVQAARIQIKNLLSSPWIKIRHKGRAVLECSNKINFIFMTNKPVSMSPGRRFIVIKAPAPREQSFYKTISENITPADLEEFKHWLITDLDLSELAYA